MALDDKAFRYFDPRTGKFEIETGEYEILVAASVSDVKLTTTVSDKQKIKAYHAKLEK